MYCRQRCGGGCTGEVRRDAQQLHNVGVRADAGDDVRLDAHRVEHVPARRGRSRQCRAHSDGAAIVFSEITLSEGWKVDGLSTIVK